MLCQDKRYFGFGDTYLIPGISTENDICNCGETIAQCNFRLQLAEQLRSRNLPPEMILNHKYCIPSTLISARFGGTRVSEYYQLIGKTLGYQRAYSSFLARENGFLESIGTLGNFDYYLDGTKNIVRADIFTAISARNQIIHLIRDPIAVLHSTATRHDDRGRSIRYSLRSWITYNTRARKLCDANADRSAIVLFDDLVSQPDVVLNTLSSKLGWKPLNVEPENLDPKMTHIIGNRSRHNATKVRAKQLKPTADDLIALGVSAREIEQVSAVYEELRQAV